MCYRQNVCSDVGRETIAKFVGNTFPGPIYPGYADRLAAGKFEVTPSSPGFPVTGVAHLACCGTACQQFLGLHLMATTAALLQMRASLRAVCLGGLHVVN